MDQIVNIAMFTMDRTVSQFSERASTSKQTMALHLIVVPIHRALSWVVIMSTDCYSNDSERPHRCCHLANNIGSRRIFSTLHIESGRAIVHSLGDPGFHPMHCSWDPPDSESASQTACRSVQPFWHGSRLCPADIHTQTTHGVVRIISNNRPHLCTPCMRCGLIISCCSNGSDGQHRRHRTDRSIVLTRCRQSALPANARFSRPMSPNTSWFTIGSTVFCTVHRCARLCELNFDLLIINGIAIREVFS